MDWDVFQRGLRLRSIKTRVALATLVISLSGLWGLSFLSVQGLQHDMERLLGEQQLSTVTMVAAETGRELDERLSTLQTVASAASLEMQKGPAEMQAFLDLRHDLHALFNGGVYVTDHQGNAIADSPLDFARRGVNYSDREYVTVPLQAGLPVIGQPVIGKRAQAPVIVMGVPLRNAQNEVIGVLNGVINLSESNFLDQIARGRQGKTGGFVMVAKRQRLVVTASDKRRIMESLPPPGSAPTLDRFVDGDEGSAVFTTSDGLEVLASAKNVPVAGWSVLAMLPTEEAFAPIRDMRQRMLLATLALTFLVTALVAWILRRQLAPLVNAAKKMSGMTGAEGALEPLPVERNDEVGELATRFNQLVVTLSERENALRDSEQRFQALHDATFGGILIHENGCILDCNQGLSAMTGFAPEVLVGTSLYDLIAEESLDTVRKNAREGTEHAYVVTGKRQDGSHYPLRIQGRFIPFKGRQVRAIEFRDLTESRAAEEKLMLAASVFSHAREAIMITAADAAIIDVNDSFTRITGYRREEVLGRNPRFLNSGRHEKSFYVDMWRNLIERGHWYGEVWNRRKNGEVFASIQTISTVKDDDGAARHYVALFSDITPLKEHERQLEHIAHYDVLTTLPNRVLLADRMHQAMAQAQRRSQRLAVAYLDLDGFKAINDHHGHEAGDQLLIALAERMKATLREGDTLARLGGDEFIAVLLDLDDVSSSVPMINRLLSAAAQPLQLGETTLQVSASLGVTFFPQSEAVDADQLLRQADQAMYQAKLAGKNRYHIFDAELDRSVRGHHESLEHIRHALNRGEFVLYYQPKVNMRTGEVIGAEALIRWQHPERGLLPPAVFLPVIEDHPLAVELGEWVIHTALTQVEQWRSAGLDITVSVNVGARQLQQADFVDRLRELLAAHPVVRPGDLEIEVLETSALEDLARVSEIIEACQTIGVSFSLDDFGTGYSSLTYLKHLSVSQLKIDRSFVRDMLDDPDDLSILGGVLSLATAFRRQVIAEGVETIEHGTMLLQLGCELAQGYGISPPMPAADFPDWIVEWRPDVAWSNLPPVDRDDLPLLFAVVEHRAWILAVEDFLRGKRETLPLSHHQCRFDSWLENEGLTQHDDQAAFRAIEPLHQKVHGLALVLCELHSHGRNHEAMERLGEFLALCDTFLAHLKALVQH